MFHCSEATGIFDVKEIEDFSQDDLIEDDLTILDARDEVYLWIGKTAKEHKVKMSRETVTEYVQCSDDGRTKCPIFVIQSGKEPLDFTTFFHGWDSEGRIPIKIQDVEKIEVNITGNPLEEGPFIGGLKAVDEKVNQSPTKQNVNEGDESEDEEIEGAIYIDYDRLMDRPLPPGLDNKHLENYLAPTKFKSLFGMTKKKFQKLPVWKKTFLKKEKHLF